MNYYYLYIFDYNVFATDFYLSRTTHLNSDCSKLFDYMKSVPNNEME